MDKSDVLFFSGSLPLSAGVIARAAYATAVAISAPAIAVVSVSAAIVTIAVAVLATPALKAVENGTLRLTLMEVFLCTSHAINALAVGILFGLGATPIALMAAGTVVSFHITIIGWRALNH